MAQLSDLYPALVNRSLSEDGGLSNYRDRQLYGVDSGSDPPIARIARINMYLHGDGGSHIYFADALDKMVRIEEGIQPELRNEREELQQLFGERQGQFDIGLTNPPFAKRYSASETVQGGILEQYEIAWYTRANGTRQRRASLKSNVMFIERYFDLLKPGGQLCTVIDESVLNTQSDKDVRQFLLNRFKIKAVVSLPQDTFVPAGSNVKTSVLLLEKKADISDDQPHTFYARCQNIGQTGQRMDLLQNELPAILDAYVNYTRSGQVPNEQKSQWNEPSRYFAKRLDASAERFDFEFLDPRHEAMRLRFNQLATQRAYRVGSLGELCEISRGRTADRYVSNGIPIIKVRNVTGEGISWDSTDSVLREFFDSSPRNHLRPLDILLTSTGLGTIGRTDMLDRDIPSMTDSHVTVLRVKDQSQVSPRYILYYLRSIFGQMQIARFTVGSTGQTELNRDDVKRLLVILPNSLEAQEQMVAESHLLENAALEARNQYRENLGLARSKFADSLGLT